MTHMFGMVGQEVEAFTSS